MTNKKLHKYFLSSRYRDRCLVFSLDDLKRTDPVSDISYKFNFSKDFLGIYQKDNQVIPVIRPRFPKELTGLHKDKSRIIVTKKGMGIVVDEVKTISKLEINLPPTYRSTLFVDGYSNMIDEKQIHFYNNGFFHQYQDILSTTFNEDVFIFKTSDFAFALKKSHFNGLDKLNASGLELKNNEQHAWFLNDKPHIPIFNPFFYSFQDAQGEFNVLFLYLNDKSIVGLILGSVEKTKSSATDLTLESNNFPFSSMLFTGMVGEYPLLNPDQLFKRYNKQMNAAA